MKKSKSSLLSAAVAGLLFGATSCTATDTGGSDVEMSADHNSCKGEQSCKGEADCKGEQSCKGEADCKGEQSCKGEATCSGDV